MAMIDRWTYVEPRLSKMSAKFAMRADKAREAADDLGACYTATRQDEDMDHAIVAGFKVDEVRKIETAEVCAARSNALAARAAAGPVINKPRASWKLDLMDKLDAKFAAGKVRSKDYRRHVGIIFHAKNPEEYAALAADQAITVG